mgnify:CR=1 FL=1
MFFGDKEENSEKVTVLLVDDDDIDAMLVKRAFKEHRLLNPLLHAIDGVEAWEMLDGGDVPKPLIILLDLNMPRMNGQEFLEKLRGDSRFRETIVFVLTTSRAEEDKVKAYNYNVAGYLLKENVGADFMQALNLLKSYWRIVEFPS